MLQFQNVSKSFATNDLFNDISFSIPKGAKVGLVGRNGTGKSTIFKILQEIETYDSGSIQSPNNYSIGALNQVIEFKHKSVIEECVEALADDEKDQTYLVEKLLSGLGFEKEDLEKDPKSFSGGYQIRINLVKVLVKKPNLLLLDEPTNYLDILSMRWLASFLRNYDGEVILITHDHDFMNKVVSHTMGIHRKKLFFTKGNTEKLFNEILEKEQLYEKTRVLQDKKRKDIEKFIDKFRSKASKASQAQSKIKLLEKMGEMDELENISELEFSFNYSEIKSKNVLTTDNISFSYDGEKELFKDLSISLAPGKCLGIIGKNGTGKSTLLNCLAEHLKITAGTINQNPNTLVGHFGQTNIERLNPNNSIAEEIREDNPNLPESKIRQICGVMMFSGELADKKIKVLSGGEKSRVMLGKIMASPANLLFLDEPTNHLDSQSIESLAWAIENFKGSIVLVTHSEMLLKRLTHELVYFKDNRALHMHGSYQDFLDKVGWDENDKKIVRSNKNSKKDIQKLRAEIIKERSIQTKPLKKSIENLENQISESELKLDSAQKNLITASEQNHADKIIENSKIVKEMEERIDELFSQLEISTDKLNKIEQVFNDKLKEI